MFGLEFAKINLRYKCLQELFCKDSTPQPRFLETIKVDVLGESTQHACMQHKGLCLPRKRDIQDITAIECESQLYMVMLCKSGNSHIGMYRLEIEPHYI